MNGDNTALLAAAISALVSLVVVILNTNYLEPRRKNNDERTLRKALLAAWISDMSSNLESLGDDGRRLEQLVIDNRPLDRLALKHVALVDKMSKLRGQILDLNRVVAEYDIIMGPILRYLQMPDPRKGEPYAGPQSESGELEVANRMKDWRDNWLSMVNLKRKRLSPLINDVKTELEKALAEEGNDKGFDRQFIAQSVNHLVSEKFAGSINTYYSHLSRLFVSSYATFFVIYASFIVFLYQTILPLEVTPFPAHWKYLAVSVVICVIEDIFLWRSMKFGNVLNRIERESFILRDNDVEINIQNYYWHKPIDYQLWNASPILGRLAVVSIPILTLILLYTTWLR